MTIHGSCPRCGNEIPHERFIDGQAVCSCGWYDDRAARRAADKTERKTIIAMIVSSVILAAGFVHVTQWGSDALSYPILKAQELTGVLSASGYEKLASICLNHRKYECTKEAYRGQYVVGRNPETLARLAKLNMQLGLNNEALQIYAQYFAAGGEEIEAAYLYGKLLEEAGQYDQALAMYETAVQKSVDTLPVHSTGAIVRLLIKLGRYEEAYSRIQSFHELSEQAKGYLNTELSQLEAHFTAAAKAGKSSRSVPRPSKTSQRKRALVSKASQSFQLK